MNERIGQRAAFARCRRPRQRAGLALGVILFAALVAAPTMPTFVHHAADRLSLAADHPDVREVARGTQLTLALMLLMVTWWVTEAVPIPVTALLPGVLLPLFHVTGTDADGLYPFDARAAFASFANPVIYLFLAGFLLAGAMRKSGLDRRITLAILSWRPVMRGPRTILLAMMVLNALLSMWISNTAATALMLPIALMVLDHLGAEPGQSRFGSALMLGIAWSASIGGMATIIGTPPNGIVVGILADQDIAHIGFLDWMKVGVPLSIVVLIAAWLLLSVLFRPRIADTSVGAAAVRQSRRELGPRTVDEAVTLAVFALVATLWVTKPFWPAILPQGASRSVERFGIHEIGLLGALLLFIVPVNWTGFRAVLDWRDARYVDWGVLILFGGGMALSDAMFKTGLTEWLADGFVTHMGRPGPWLCLALVVLLIDFLTEITSNTAVISMMTPILIGLAPRLGLSPLTLCIAAAMASSLAFMLPVATPPNALVFGTGYFTVGRMARAGFWMNLLGCALLVACLYLLAGGVTSSRIG